PDPDYMWPIGVIPKWIYIATHMSFYEVIGGGFNFLFVSGIIALITTVAIFFIVVYVESTRIEIPLTHSAVRGARGRFPVKLIYASVLPMILVRALQANIQMFGMLLYSRGITILGTYEGNRAVSGLMYYLDPIHSPYDWFPGLVSPEYAPWQIGLRIGADLAMMVIGGMIFAVFWIYTTGMGPKDVARQIHRSGLQIPGYRRSIGSIEKVMERYIPKVTIIGGAFIGLLCVMANMLGTLGDATGTGILLTVSIVYRLYEEVASEQMMEMYPILRKFLGGE
ncbi:MAG: preprotein translocase subunit SecY, partial [Candidatus Syntropharchaeia archaeon]